MASFTYSCFGDCGSILRSAEYPRTVAQGLCGSCGTKSAEEQAAMRVRAERAGRLLPEAPEPEHYEHT